MGASVLAIDFRLQGGKTGTSGGFAEGPTSILGLGIMDKKKSNLFNLFSDGLRAVEAAKKIPEIDISKIAITGGSQGGGVALAVAALNNEIKLAMADVPSSCWFEKRVFEKSGGAADIAQFIKNRPENMEKILENLKYFDNVNLAGMIKCPVIISCGLRDPVCPPDTIYAAYNNIKAEKKIFPYVFAEHEGGGCIHNKIKYEYFKKYILDVR
jgi:cephalosporin-C deacetylase